MKILNLANLEASEIKYEVSKFPDGQQQVKINTFFIKSIKLLTVDTVVNNLFAENFPVWNIPVQIKSRLNNFKDLELICCAAASLKELGVKEIHLYIPYFLGSRSDRKFEDGSNNYLKTVICPIINSLGLSTVTVLDPHSDVLEALITNFKKQDNVELVKFALKDIFNNVQ